MKVSHNIFYNIDFLHLNKLLKLNYFPKINTYTS